MTRREQIGACNLYLGDCREVLATLPAASVQCVVTSPPYYGLRCYGHEKQIGLEQRPDCLGWATGAPCGTCYVCSLVAVFREVRRVLRDDGVVFLNLGDSYYAGSRRAAACDTSGKAPASSPERGCLCGSLCDACRRAYRIGKSHSGAQPAPMPSASMPSSSLGRKGSRPVRLPTSGSAHPDGRSVGAIPDLGRDADRDPEPHPVSPASTIAGCDPQPPGLRSRASSPAWQCRLCGRSLAHCAQASADKLHASAGSPHCMEGNVLPSGELASRSQYTDECCSLCVAQSAPTQIEPQRTTGALKAKDLCLIPARVALALQADGWFLRSEIIWAKAAPMPESVRDRPTCAHEKVWLLSKRPTYFYDAASVHEQAVGISGRAPVGHLGARNPHGGGDSGLRRGWEGSATRNARNVWADISPEPSGFSHYAMMPTRLAERCIKAGTSDKGCCPGCGAPWARVTERATANREGFAAATKNHHGAISQAQSWIRDGKGRAGDSAVTTTGWSPGCACPPHDPVPCAVLDPFAGGFTTLVVAERLQRAGIGIDLNPAYLDIGRARLEQEAPLFAVEPTASAAPRFPAQLDLEEVA